MSAEKRTISVQLPKSIVDQLKKKANLEYGGSIQEMFSRLLEEYLEKEKASLTKSEVNKLGRDVEMMLNLEKISAARSKLQKYRRALILPLGVLVILLGVGVFSLNINSNIIAILGIALSLFAAFISLQQFKKENEYDKYKAMVIAKFGTNIRKGKS